MATVLITGVGRGIGRELARQYAEDGWRVIGTCRKPADGADLARAGDTVLLAGKGHETYQVIGREKVPFDERDIVAAAAAAGPA